MLTIKNAGKRFCAMLKRHPIFISICWAFFLAVFSWAEMMSDVTGSAIYNPAMIVVWKVRILALMALLAPLTYVAATSVLDHVRLGENDDDYMGFVFSFIIALCGVALLAMWGFGYVHFSVRQLGESLYWRAMFFTGIVCTIGFVTSLIPFASAVRLIWNSMIQSLRTAPK